MSAFVGAGASAGRDGSADRFADAGSSCGGEASVLEDEEGLVPAERAHPTTVANESITNISVDTVLGAPSAQRTRPKLRGSSAARSASDQAVVGRRPTGRRVSDRCASRCARASWVQSLHARETRRPSSKSPVVQEPCASRFGVRRSTQFAVTLPEQRLLWKNASPARTLSGSERD
jgi:hypothetical protein